MQTENLFKDDARDEKGERARMVSISSDSPFLLLFHVMASSMLIESISGCQRSSLYGISKSFLLLTSKKKWEFPTITSEGH